MLIRNTWYMAGWNDEVGETGFSREIMDQRIFFYRTSAGIAALRDRCPHRFAPISLGTQDGDNRVCGYHGLAFSPTGKCVHNPFFGRIPAGTDNLMDLSHIEFVHKGTFAGQGVIFAGEHKPMIEAAYANVRSNLAAGGTFWQEKPVALGIDSGGTRARRLLEAMIAREAAC